MALDLFIRELNPEDWKVVSQIYKEGLDTGIATYETEVPSWKHWDKKMLSFCRFVAQDYEGILGWVALSPTSQREVYKGVAEVSVYVSSKARGKGVGKALLQHLLIESERAGIWTLQSSIFAENKISIDLHLKVGFRIVGTRQKIAQRNGKWSDNVLMERRSQQF